MLESIWFLYCRITTGCQGIRAENRGRHLKTNTMFLDKRMDGYVVCLGILVQTCFILKLKEGIKTLASHFLFLRKASASNLFNKLQLKLLNLD
jgi:hypothetical protein